MVALNGCQSGVDKFAGDREPNPEKDKDGKPKGDPKRGGFAEDREPAEVKQIPFDGKQAMEYLKALCDIGPRISGSEGMAKQQEMLQKHFEKLGAKVELQKFEGKQQRSGKTAPMANMIVTWNPDAKRRIMLCGHYDTRPIADQEERRADWGKTFLSANDGTSTVALFMELGNHMKDLPRKIGIDFVIFDGEEFIYDSKVDRFFLGSDHFADVYRKDKPDHTYLAGVLLDLFAGKDAKFPVEQNSARKAPEIVESIWQEAQRQGVKSFVLERGPEVQDDHLALNRVNIPTIDIIDFEYPHWHKLSDLPQHCSGDTMASVARVLTAWIQRLK